MFPTQIIIHPDARIRQEFVTQFALQHHIHAADLLQLSGDSIGIKEIRGVQAKLTQKPFGSPFVCVSINAHALSLEAQQALLKTLEEPPKSALILLLAAAPDLLLPTIQSRCLLVSLDQSNQPTQSLSDQKDLETFWHDLFIKTFGERLKLAQSLVTEKEQTIEFLKKQIGFLRRQLLNAEEGDTQSRRLTLRLIKSAQKTHTLVEKNISYKLALDHFFLEIPLKKIAQK